MSQAKALLSERARSLLLAFAISHNASDFCRFLTVVALREFGAKSSLMVRVEADSTLRTVGHYGLHHPDQGGKMTNSLEVNALKRAITHNRILELEQLEPKVGSEDGFIAIPFNPSGEMLGALGITFRRPASQVEIPLAELELLQLLSELISVNSLPRMRASGLLSKLYFDEESLDEISEITHRQLRVLDEMALGRTNIQIAHTLNLSESTIKQECGRIFKILGVSSRQRAVSVGKEMGLI